MRILICGGREFDDYEKFEKVLNWFHNIKGLCHGGARGADMLTHRYMQENFTSINLYENPWEIEYKVFPANWNTYGKSAGFIRNIEMLNTFKPDLVIAFPGGQGTKHMVRYSKDQGYNVLEIS